MRPLRSLLVYVAIIFVGGALLAPWMYFAVQAGVKSGWHWQKLAESPFHRYLNRAFLGIALIGLWPFLRVLGMRRWSDIGWGNPIQTWRQLATGFLFGFCTLAVLALLALGAGARTFNADHSLSEVCQQFLKIILTAVLVAILEEILFRGALFGALRKAYSWVWALLISSAVYALVHFFARPAEPAAIDWLSGLEMLPQMLRGFVEWQTLVPGFFNLALAGVMLGWAYQKSGGLAFSIGLHAGWIFWLKANAFLTRPAAGGNVWIWGSEKLIDGWMALLVLTAAFCVLCRGPWPRRETADEH